MSSLGSGELHSVVVVGGGWAGLAAAVELADQGVPVTLIEAAPRLGGRARTLLFEDRWVDNGPHILVGAYHELLDLLQRLKMELPKMFLRQSMKLHMRCLDGKDTRISTAPLPAPFHMAAGCLTASGLSVQERMQLLRFGRYIPAKGPDADISVATMLRRHHQSDRVIRILWEPLCVAALNTPIQTASAQLFLQVLRETFCGARANSDLLIPRAGMADLLPGPAQQFIEGRGGKVILGQRVHGISLHDGVITGVQMGGQTLQADKVIVAVAPSACQDLLAPHEALTDVNRQIAALNHYPICSVYLRFPPAICLEYAMIGIIGGTAQWMFDYRTSGQPGLMAVIISGPGPHMDLSTQALGTHVAQEIARLYPDWPAPDSTLVIREKSAAFASVVNIESRRPGHQTPVAGLWLAGDYTATGLPGTLESAVRSGVRCARAIIDNRPPLSA